MKCRLNADWFEWSGDVGSLSANNFIVFENSCHVLGSLSLI
jgi:hypothetical protein